MEWLQNTSGFWNASRMSSYRVSTQYPGPYVLRKNRCCSRSASISFQCSVAGGTRPGSTSIEEWPSLEPLLLLRCSRRWVSSVQVVQSGGVVVQHLAQHVLRQVAQGIGDVLPGL